MERTPREDNASQILYRHTKRPRWGLAVRTWERDEKRAFQFEDGRLRIFKRGFYGMLEEVDPPADRAQRALERLYRAMGRNELAKSRGSKLIPIADQISYFKELEPDGFAGDSWTERMRGSGGKALKRHRDPAVKRAREQLGRDRLDRLIAARQYDELIDGLIDVLERTTLVTKNKIEPLRSATLQRRESIAIALRDLLYGEGALDARFDELVRAIGAPSWELATAPLALVDPEQHVCVRPSVFEQQSLWMAPRLERSKSPTSRTYLRYLEMARAVAKKLAQAGLPARDLLDVHDFIYLTLRPAARKILAERGAKPTEEVLRPVAEERVAEDREAA